MECGWGVVILLILYIIWDVNYFIRVVFTVVFGRLVQKKVKLTNTTSILENFSNDKSLCFNILLSQLQFVSLFNIYTFFNTPLGFCTSQDVDIFIRHMNNARYVRELDFARFHFYALTGLYEAIKKSKGGAVQGASSVRYRRTIPIFSSYRVETKLIWWDEKAIYLEQKFITSSDNFVRAIATSKQCITNVNVLELMKKFPECADRPAAPEELEIWLNAIELSSQKLRKDK